MQPVESKDAATQDNETTSGAKAGTESHRPADGLEDNLTTNWPPALGQSAQCTKLFDNFEVGIYIMHPPPSQICAFAYLGPSPMSPISVREEPVSKRTGSSP
eukprot:CAMPEP_0182573614 /NCGR_PEP_ID=MMETSP1324-20130603/20321_1 /TAXON_ID=236786 /ORGANISM="Florenciella sp., Strain RCC1587" /LENGTH=101 /DNA_ID=CAMNT_0024788749 /DNA_START=191 /DNA_END=496 /DNA_ORIENTATION=+